jgi:hypothetical protein
VVMVNRKAIPLTANHRLRQVISDTAAAQFPAEVTRLADDTGIDARHHPIGFHSPVLAHETKPLAPPGRSARPHPADPGVQGGVQSTEPQTPSGAATYTVLLFS